MDEAKGKVADIVFRVRVVGSFWLLEAEVSVF